MNGFIATYSTEFHFPRITAAAYTNVANTKNINKFIVPTSQRLDRHLRWKRIRISPSATFKCAIALKLKLRIRNSKFLRSLPYSRVFITHVWNILFCFSFADPLHHNWQCPLYENCSINWGVCAWRKLRMAWNLVLLAIYKFYCYDHRCTGENTMKVEVNVFSSSSKYRQYDETVVLCS